MNRRSLFGAVAGAAIGGPAAARDVAERIGHEAMGAGQQIGMGYATAPADVSHLVTPEMWALREELESSNDWRPDVPPGWEPPQFAMLRSVKRSVKLAWAMEADRRRNLTYYERARRLLKMCKAVGISCPIPIMDEPEKRWW